MIRVGAPPALDPLTAGLFRSAQRVWQGILSNLEGPGLELVEEDPDVWLWDAYRGDRERFDEPVIGVIHEAPGDDQGVSPLFLEHLDTVGRRFVSLAERLVTCSSYSRGVIAERYGADPGRIHVVPYGVDLDVFRPDGPAGLPDDGADGRPYVLFVGAVLPRKNLPLLRLAMERLPSHRLVVVASPCVDERTAELLDEAVSPIGGHAVPNHFGIDDEGLAGLMRGAAALCLPSMAEGFGLPVAEAMACGTPVVVSDRGSLPELVGAAGIVVAPEVDAIADGLARAIADPDGLRARGLERAGQLTWERTGDGVRAVIEHVASTSPREARSVPRRS